MMLYPLVNEHNYGKPPFLIDRSTIWWCILCTSTAAGAAQATDALRALPEICSTLGCVSCRSPGNAQKSWVNTVMGMVYMVVSLSSSWFTIPIFIWIHFLGFHLVSIHIDVVCSHGFGEYKSFPWDDLEVSEWDPRALLWTCLGLRDL